MQKPLTFALLIALMPCCALQSGAVSNVPEQPLVEPQARASNLQFTQSLELTWQDETYQLLGVVELTSRRTAMAVFTPVGLKLFSIVQKDKTLTIEKNPMLPERIEPRRILGAAQLVNWSSAALKSTLNAPWRLEEGNNVRRLWWHNVLVTEAVYEGSIAEWQTVKLTDPRAGYRLSILALSTEEFE